MWCLLQVRKPFEEDKGRKKKKWANGYIQDLDSNDFHLPPELAHPIPMETEALNTVKKANPDIMFSVFHLKTTGATCNAST